MSEAAKTNPSLSVAVIGFGEAGSILAADLVKAGAQSVATYDILFDRDERGPAMMERAEKAGVHPARSAAEAAAGADLILVAVTASSSLDVARSAAGFIAPGQFYLDINSVAPSTKQKAAELIEQAGGRYVDVAVMAPVPPYRLKVPMAIGGPWGPLIAERLAPFGFAMEVFDREIGYVSAMKMCRSVMIKSIEALIIESMTSACTYGVEDQVLVSLGEYFPGVDWREHAEYMFSRVIQHGERRAAEMREAAKTVADIGLEPLMTASIADRQQWVADHVPRDKFKGQKPKLRDYAAAIRSALEPK